MTNVLWIAALLVAVLGSCHAFRPSTCGFATCHKVKPGMLNVHLIPSSHTDLGWLKTVDQYYYGSKSWVHKVGVQYIYQSVINELRNNPNRRFAIAEVAYLWKWWQEQTGTKREQVKDLVNSGRLEIVNGGWSMNDEAVTSYQAIIDQYTWGFSKLNKMFGPRCARPRVGWQVDPYGHSKELASLYSQFGFDGMFISRIDYQDKSNRLQSKAMEMVWTPSANLGPVSHIFTSILFNMHRSPDGFCFDILCRNDAIVDDIHSREYNVDLKVQQFIDYCEDQAKYYASDNIAIVMGDDFHFQSAPSNFINMDKLIRHVNSKQQTGSRVRLLYSTPSCYLKALNEANMTWTTKEDDFFPYANDLHSYWTGYYTSRPTSKYMERVGNNYLQICKQLHSLAGLEERDEAEVDVMREAMGIMQHHDAITGTERQAVADDYHAMLHNGFMQCEKSIKKSLRKIATNLQDEPVADEDGNSTRFIIDSCLMRNVSQCSVSETSETFVVTVYNPMSQTTSHHVRLPVVGKGFTVQDPNGDDVITQMVPIPINVLNLRGRTSKALEELVFTADDLPPMGFKSYYVSKQSGNNGPGRRSSSENSTGVKDDTDDPKHIYNEKMHVFFNPVDGQLKEIQMNTLGGERFRLMQNFHYYTSQGSGAYLFRPANESTNITVDCGVHLITYKGDVVDEVHQTFCPWVSQVVRLYKMDSHVEFEWMVGPIPIEDGTGKDVLTRFTTDLDSEDQFYTDANGRELVKRKIDSRASWKLEVNDPVAGNYYPVATRILIRDQKKRMEFAVLTDRPQGGTSLRSGEIELMVHRRFMVDDSMGLNEPLNEEEYEQGLVARGKHYVMAGRTDIKAAPNLAMQERNLAQKILNGPWVFVTPADNYTFRQWESTFLMNFRGLKESLPSNIHVLTLEPWKDKTLLLRLEHIMEAGEDEKMCKPVTIEIDDLFTPFPVLNVEEMVLGANQPLCEMKKLEWLYSSTMCESNQRQCLKRNKSGMTKISLKPMEIRTFVIEIKN